MRDEQPVAIAHFPSASIWPFAMSVAFVLILAGALIDNGPLALLGTGATLVSLAGWFWPSDSQRLALEETRGAAERGELPLAVHGPISNGWWGTIVMIAVYAIALVTMIASYLYLATRWDEVELPDTLSAVMAAVVLGSVAGSAMLNWWSARGARRDERSDANIRRFGLTLSALMDVAAAATIWLLFSYHEVAPRAAGHTQQSLLYLFLVFALTTVLTHLAMVGMAAVWAWRAPADERGLAPAKNGALMGWFSAASWLATGAIFYVVPRFS